MKQNIYENIKSINLLISLKESDEKCFLLLKAPCSFINDEI